MGTSFRPPLFLITLSIKKDWVRKKKKVNFFKAFDNPFSKYLIFKRISECNGCFGLFAKIKRDLGLAFGAYFLHDFSIKMFLI